jgi:hypothetical protein
MFVEGPTVHSATVLRQAAEEFQRLHWWRVVLNVSGSAAIFRAFLVCYRLDTAASRPAGDPR